MILHQIVSGAIGRINPHTSAIWRKSTGYSTSDSGEQIPVYEDQPVTIQVQALSGDELRQIDGLNIQGSKVAVYLNGQERGVVRTGQRGGDLFVFGNQTWLTIQVLENWPDWTKLALVLQNGG